MSNGVYFGIDNAKKIGLLQLQVDGSATQSEVTAALELKADISDVDAKNTLQDAAILAADNLAKAAIPKTQRGAVNGVATLGADSKITPSQLPTQTIAYKRLSGVVGAAAGDTKILHGLDSTKILDVSIVIGTSVAGQFVKSGYTSSTLSFSFFFDASDVVVRITTGNGANLFGRGIKILITHEV